MLCLATGWSPLDSVFMFSAEEVFRLRLLPTRYNKVEDPVPLICLNFWPAVATCLLGSSCWFCGERTFFLLIDSGIGKVSMAGFYIFDKLRLVFLDWSLGFTARCEPTAAAVYVYYNLFLVWLLLSTVRLLTIITGDVVEFLPFRLPLMIRLSYYTFCADIGFKFKLRSSLLTPPPLLDLLLRELLLLLTDLTL